MYILGINESKIATAAICKDGEILACVSEERFTRIKNQSGFPKKSVDFCLKEAGIKISDIDLVVLGAKNPVAAIWYRRNQKSPVVRTLRKTEAYVTDIIASFYNLYPFVLSIHTFFYKLFFYIYILFKPVIRRIHHRQLARKLKVPLKKIIFADHHTAHAFAANYIFGMNEENRLVITNDGAGDGVCGRVFVVKKDYWQEIAETSNKYSLGYLYYFVTKLLGFKPDDEEYKVMGLAPYASKSEVDKIYPIFKSLFWVNGLSFKSKVEKISLEIFLKAKLSGIRFDIVAATLQRLVEDLIVKQVENAVLKTGIKNVILGGGLAMNIKANMEVNSSKLVKNLLVCPSPTDESVAIGACFWGYYKLCQKNRLSFNPKSATNLYLGPKFDEHEIREVLKKQKILNSKFFHIKKLNGDQKYVAKLLSEGKIVSRFAGRGEFGARALGNRSIVADPRDAKVVRTINKKIKGRDFWMPFAPTILKERSSDYLINPKKNNSPFMMVGFKTTQTAQEEISATLHPYDQTCRPQILKKEDNTDYYDFIKEFEKLTGVGAILNTSFNIHGEPIVCTPEDAIRTFKKSKLEYLLLEDYLISKK